MTIEFDDSEYRFTHGKRPGGRGSWAFDFPRAVSTNVRTGDGLETWWAKAADGSMSMTLTEAKKLARAEAQRRYGETNAHVVIRVAT